MAVILVNRFAHPDLSASARLLSDLAFDLAGRGGRVHVIAGRRPYDAPPGAPDLAALERVGGVTIHRVATTRFGRARLAGRAVDSLTFCLAAAWRLWRLARAGDVVVAKTDPPLLSVVAAPVCRARGAYSVNWLQDLFPEVAQALGLGRRWGPAYALLARLRTASLRAASANVAVGEGMAARVAALGVPRARLHVIPNWADAAIRPVAHADNPFRREAGLGGAFVVAYSGNLGRVHEVATLVEAMVRLAGAPGAGRAPIRWLFIGGGAQTPALRARVGALGLPGVTFLPYQPRAALDFSLSAADVHLASLRPEFEGLVVPSKVGGVLAAGRPLLFVGDPDGEVGRLIARHGCGRAFAPGDGDGLARAVAALAGDPAACAEMGRRALACAAGFDRSAALARWAAVLDAAGRG